MKPKIKIAIQKYERTIRIMLYDWVKAGNYGHESSQNVARQIKEQLNEPLFEHPEFIKYVSAEVMKIDKELRTFKNNHRALS